jgi:tricorn protease-like protein
LKLNWRGKSLAIDIEFREEEFEGQFNGRTLLRILAQARAHWKWMLGFILAVAIVSALESYFTYLGKLIIDEGIMAGDKAALLRLMLIYGSLILFRSDRDGDGEIYVVDVATQTETRLTFDVGEDGKPTWAPSGLQIAWVSNRGGDFEVYVADYDPVTRTLSNITNVTNNAANDFMPDWSPDGTKIAFASDRDGDFEVYSINPDGTGLSQLTTVNGATDWEPSWSP